MGLLLIRLKVLPSEAGADLESMVQSIQSKLPTGATIKTKRPEPIAFGLEAVILEIVAEEKEGITDEVESAVASAENVSSVEFAGVSRVSAKLH